MIVDALLGFIQSALTGLAGVIPAFTVPSWFEPGGWISSLNSLAGWAGSMSNWVPWTTIIGALAVAWFVRGGMVAVALIMKVYAMVRGGAS